MSKIKTDRNTSKASDQDQTVNISHVIHNGRNMAKY